jgi:hypothetical protein
MSTPFPREAADGAEPLIGGFRTWLRHFDAGWVASQGDWHCYHPRSMQARAMTCSLGKNTSTHHVLGGSASNAFPDGNAAIRAMRAIDHIGVVDLFYESWCVLLHTVGTAPLPASCDCRHTPARRRAAAAFYPSQPWDPVPLKRRDDDTTDHAADEIHYDHSQPGEAIPPHSVASLPPDVLKLIDALTRADQALFRAGAVRLVAAAAAAEKETRVPILCPERFYDFLHSTRYIPGLEADARAAYATRSR